MYKAEEVLNRLNPELTAGKSRFVRIFPQAEKLKMLQILKN